jgi:hypothetical protein
MVQLVHGETLFDVGREIARGALELSGPAVVFHVPVQVPLVRRSKVTDYAFDHRHRMVLDVLAEPGLDVGDIVALDAPIELDVGVLALLVVQQLGVLERRELTDRTLELFVVAVVGAFEQVEIVGQQLVGRRLLLEQQLLGNGIAKVDPFDGVRSKLFVALAGTAVDVQRSFPRLRQFVDALSRAMDHLHVTDLEQKQKNIIKIGH